jgi:hypothetical protein
MRDEGLGGIWRFGDLEIWRLGDLEIWRFGDLEIWGFGDLGIWGLENEGWAVHRPLAPRAIARR